MPCIGIRGVQRGKKQFTTTPDTTAPRPPDLVDRRFVASRPNELRLADITYASTWEGWLYVLVLVTWARGRWPGISNTRLLGGLLVTALCVDAEDSIEIPIVALGLWTYAPSPVSIPLGGGGFRYALPELFVGVVFFAPLIALRLFRDDKGRTPVERGLEHHTPRGRKWITLLALYALFQLVSWGPDFSMYYLGFSRSPGPACRHTSSTTRATRRASTEHATASAREALVTRMPGRHSLPGRSP